MSIYTISTHPFKDPVQNTMEVLNELTFAIVSYSFLLFTDFNLNPDFKNYAGWGLIGVTLLNIGVNYLVVIFKTVARIV